MGDPDWPSPSEKSVSVPPLTSLKKDGQLYTRRADVKAIIVDMLARPVQEWPEAASKTGSDTLPSEALVFLIRRIRHDEKNVLGALIDVLTQRIVRTARRWSRGFDPVQTEEILVHVEDRIYQRLFAATPSPQTEFLEVAFHEAVKRLTLNVVEKVDKKPPMVVISERKSEEYDEPAYVIDSIPESGPGPEEVLLQLADEKKRKFLVSKALASVKDPRHVHAVILRYVHGWPITDMDPTKPSIAKHFGKSEKQIRNWIKGALATMRTAIGDSQ